MRRGPLWKGGNVDVAEIAAIQKRGDASTLPLCNYFAPLHEDCELPSGEAKLDENDTNQLSINTLLESAEIMDRVSKEMVCLDPVTQSKVSNVVENVSIESATLNTKHNMMAADKGFVKPIISAPTPPTQCRNAEKQLSLSAAAVSANFSMDPNHVQQCVSTEQDKFDAPIISPVTFIDEILGPDKGRINKPANTKNNSDACRKSEKILRKFWADELDTDQTSDSTLEPDINAERRFSSFTVSPNVDKYLLQLTDTSKKGKRGRPKKTKSPKDISGTKAKHKATVEVFEADSDIVCTRSKSHNTNNISK